MNRSRKPNAVLRGSIPYLRKPLRCIATLGISALFFGCASGGGNPGATSNSTGGSGGAPNVGGSAGNTNTGGECGAITTFENGLAPEREVHVAVDGSPDGDGSVQDPVDTIERGLDLATPGTAVRIHAGTYAGGAYASSLQGTAEAPLWIGGAPGEERPVIDGSDQALQLSQPRYLILHDLEIRNQTANGINVDDGGKYDDPEAARFVVFRNLYIHDVGTGGNQDCLKLSGLNEYYVLDSRFARCGAGGSAIDHVGCHRGLIAKNVLEELDGSGVQCKGGSEDIEIRQNRITGGGQRAVNMGGSTGTEFFRPPLSATEPNFEARDIRVIANVFVGGIVPLAFVGCVDCLAANNTIVDPENWIVRILQESVSDEVYTFLPAQNGRFVNNVVYFSRGQLSTYVNVGGDTQPDTFLFSNNVWYAHDDPDQSTPNLPVDETDGLYAQDPELVAPDYSITASSPATSAGVTLGEVPADHSGRCYLEPPSAGAFEQ